MDRDRRMLCVSDPQRQAVILAAGDKAGAWSDWYKVNISIAEDRYAKWLRGESADDGS